jgi:hypothetical protein
MSSISLDEKIYLFIFILSIHFYKEKKRCLRERDLREGDVQEEQFQLLVEEGERVSRVFD